jgi:hypothetical protein
MPVINGKALIYNWKENLYILSLCAFLTALPTSVAYITGTTIALLSVWVVTGEYKEKWNRLIHNRNALLLMSISLLYLVGLAFTHNLSLGLRELNKSAYWFIFAFVLGSSSPISSKATFRLLGIYILTVVIAVGASFITIVFSSANPLLNFRSITWIDHIPFSYQIVFVIWLLIYFALYKSFSAWGKTLLFLLISFLLTSLLLLKSFNGYLYFGAMTITAFIMFIGYAKKRALKLALIGGLILILILPVGYIYYCVQKFYDTKDYTPESIEKYTANGNLYLHDFEDKTIENGHYLYLFICEEELKPLWNTHSKKNYHSYTSDGYFLSSVVLRYMTSKGLPKDAQGFAQLTQKDIENIENEITNYIFAEHRLSIYSRIYETIWEIDQFRTSKNPNKKSSVQRYEQALLAQKIIKKHPWLGIGLGNNVRAYEEVIVESGSILAPQTTGSSHNQYLNYLIRFGILGTLFILGVLIWVFIKGRKNNPFLITLFFVSMCVANFGEANWETFIGLNFFAFFMCFFMWLVPKEIVKK